MTTIIIEDSSPQAKQFVKFIRTLPFAEVKRRRTLPQNQWDKAIAEGAVTVDEFFDELDERLKRRFNA